MSKKEQEKAPSLAEQAMGLIPKPATVEVEIIKEMAGIKVGHKKSLEVSNAKDLEKLGYVKIIKNTKQKNEDENI